MVRRSLAGTLLILTAMASIVFALVISAVEVRQDETTSIADEKLEAQEIVNATIDTLSLAVWTYDERTLDVAASGLTGGTSIYHVAVLEDDHASREWRRPGSALIPDYSWDVPILRPGTRQRIGTLKLWESYEDVRTRLKQRTPLLVASELAKVVTSSILLYIITYILVAHPLRTIARLLRSAESDDSGTISIRRSIGGGDEIDALVDALNDSNRRRRQMLTEQKRLQAREASAGKLQALGRLAGGLAHDMNNVLGVILGFAGILRDDLKDSPEMRGFTDRIVKASERGRDLIKQMWVFTNAGSAERTPLDFLQLVRENVSYAETALPKTTKLIMTGAAGELPVLGSKSQLAQLVVNLCNNASEAYDGRPGEVRVGTSRAEPPEIDRLRRGSMQSGEQLVGDLESFDDFACLRISDNAGGIAEEILDLLFEPFFTTKKWKGGTGLGLSVVHSIVSNHGGACLVQTRLGEGTTFCVYLPLTTAPLTAMPRPDAIGDITGSENVLVVDDEPDIVDAVCLTLRRWGYRATGETNPQMALERFLAAPQAWDAIITDDAMPEMRGLELISRIRSVRPDIKVIVCTGHSKIDGDDSALAGPHARLLLKPVDSKTLVATLRALADLVHSA